MNAGHWIKLIFNVWQKSCNTFRAARFSAASSLRSTEPVANYTLLTNDFGRHNTPCPKKIVPFLYFFF
jgi:hypothetical protein